MEKIKKVVAIGTAYLMVGQLIFVFCSYLMNIFLGRYLGPALYGICGIIFSLLNIISVILVRGIPQALSKFVAESKKNAVMVLRAASRIQLYFCLIFTSVPLVFGNLMAFFLNDANLVPYIRLTALIIFPMGFYSLYTFGYLNGRREFKKQAFVRGFVSVLKLLAILFFVLIGLQVYGVIFGYLFSVIAGFLLARFLSKTSSAKNRFSQKKLLKFAAPVIGSLIIYTITSNLGVLFVKNILSDNISAGYYTAAATISRLIAFVFVALQFTILPSISKSVAENKIKLTRKYINQSMRYMLMLILPMAFLMSATSKNLIILLYSNLYVNAAPVLSILAFGMSFMIIFYILTTIINGSGYPKITLFFNLIVFPLSVILYLLLIPQYNIVGAAVSFTMAFAIGLIIAVCYIFKRFRTFMSLKSFARITIASLIVYFIAIGWQFSGLYIILTYLILGALYFVILFILREIKKEDMALLGNLFR